MIALCIYVVIWKSIVVQTTEFQSVTGCWSPSPAVVECGGYGEADVVLDQDGRRMLRPQKTEDDL